MVHMSPGPIAALVLALSAGACSPAASPQTSPSSAAASTQPSAASIVGTWKCGPPENPTLDTVDIRADGTVSINGAEPMRWSLTGTRGAFQTPDGDDPFTVESDRIVFADGFTCTRG